MPSNYDAGFAAGQAAAVKAIQKLIDRSASVEDERDEWKRLHEELVEVRRADLAAVATAHAKEVSELRAQLAVASPLPEAAEPVAQAPTQAGEVALLAEEAKHEAREASECVYAENAATHLARMDTAIDRLAALSTQPLAAPLQHPGPSGDVPSDFQEGQWWLQKLDEVAAAGTDDFKRAVAVVRNLMRTAHAQVATPPAHPVLAPVVREPLSDERINLICRQELCQEDGHDYYAYSNAVHWWAEEGQIAAFVRAIEAAHGIQATTGEQSHG